MIGLSKTNYLRLTLLVSQNDEYEYFYEHS